MKKLLASALLALSLSTSALAYDFAPSAGPKYYGIGVATSRDITDAASAVTGWIDLRSDLGLQLYLSLPSTSPFQFGVAGLLKYNVMGTPTGVGVHLGGGIGLADIPEGGGHVFGAVIDGVVGLHFPFPGSSNVRFQMDAGPSLRITNGAANFAIETFSPLLGLSVMYMFQ